MIFQSNHVFQFGAIATRNSVLVVVVLALLVLLLSIVDLLSWLGWLFRLVGLWLSSRLRLGLWLVDRLDWSWLSSVLWGRLVLLVGKLWLDSGFGGWRLLVLSVTWLGRNLVLLARLLFVDVLLRGFLGLEVSVLIMVIGSLFLLIA